MVVGWPLGRFANPLPSPVSLSLHPAKPPLSFRLLRAVIIFRDHTVPALIGIKSGLKWQTRTALCLIVIIIDGVKNRSMVLYNITIADGVKNRGMVSNCVRLYVVHGMRHCVVYKRHDPQTHDAS